MKRLTALLALVPTAMFGQVLTPSQDAYVVPGNGTNFGTVQTLTVGSSASQGLVQFDLTHLPAGLTASQIGQATLTLFLDHVGAAGTVTVFVANGNWTEAGVNGNNAPAPGAVVATNVGVSIGNTFMTVDATQAVKDWIGGITPNSGFLILPAASGTSVQFDSKENTATSHAAMLSISVVPTGVAGPTGATGLSGTNGATGATGPAGTTGAVGATGANGATGATGAVGSTGANGLTGATGPVGSTGSAGPSGANGATGTIGPAGVTGARGATGATGTNGTNGANGAPGPQGPTGPASTTGQSVTSVFGTGPLTVNATSLFTFVPGLTNTIAVSAGQLVRITSTGGISTTSNTATGYSQTDVAIFVDGTIPPNGAFTRITAANITNLVFVIANWSLDGAFSIPPGVHTIAIGAEGSGIGSTATVSGNVTSALQGTLTVQLLNQ